VALDERGLQAFFVQARAQRGAAWPTPMTMHRSARPSATAENQKPVVGGHGVVPF